MAFILPCVIPSPRGLTKVPADLHQVNGLCLMWLGLKTKGLLCLWLFSHPCSEESSCHAVTFPTERTVRQGTEDSIWRKAREKWGPQFNTAGGTDSCQQPHEWAWKQTHPYLSLQRTAALAHRLTAVWLGTLSQRTLLSGTQIWTHRNCEMINIIVLSHEALG